MSQFSVSSWFKGIRGRLLFAAVLPVIGFVILGMSSYKGINKLIDLLSVANDQVIPTYDVIGEMRQARNKYSYQVLNAIAAGQDAELRKSRIDQARSGMNEFRKAQEIYDPIPRTPEEDVSYQEVRPLLPEFYKAMEDILVLVESGDPQKFVEAEKLLNGRLVEVGSKVRKWNGDVHKIYGEMAKQGVKDAQETKASVTNFLLFVTLFSAFAIFGVLLWIAARITNSVGSISDRLTVAGAQVSTAVEQLNEAGNSLSQSSTEAAASLEETVASLEELSSMVQMNSDNAKQAATLSLTSKEAAERGEAEIQMLIKSMSNISTSSKKIEEIISVIDDIAFQTNLLALNAAVEAARAGEQGKGFAVVADAVRTLAQKSADAAKDITSLIKQSVSQVEEGSRFADQSGAVLNNITNSVKKVSDLNAEIAAASTEQSSGIQQISKAMNQLDQAAQSNAASSEEIAATSGEIAGLAVTAQNLTVELNAVILGGNNTTKPSEVPTSSVNKTTVKKGFTPTEEKKTSNVVSFKAAAKKAPVKTEAAKAIPFDEDEDDSAGRGKVGTTDGF
ncbi:methyl-accepting chemotaxis protein [Bdellovibrio sp. HCB337]|uniref:HAMP domain-containing methyl-accepting chemotaxis protein n=1 Tax=Bdellovibrio sp. HCB337 TaxID=3394358 RepID=UPI0039A6929B